MWLTVSNEAKLSTSENLKMVEWKGEVISNTQLYRVYWTLIFFIISALSINYWSQEPVNNFSKESTFKPSTS